VPDPVADRGRARDPADELRPDYGAGATDVAPRHQPASDQNRHARAAAGPGRRAVDLAGANDRRVRTLKFVSLSRERSGELTEREAKNTTLPLGHVSPTRATLGMLSTEGDFYTSADGSGAGLRAITANIVDRERGSGLRSLIRGPLPHRRVADD
jgi:hypothetical protein